VIPSQKLIRPLESQGGISRTRSSLTSPVWPVRKSNGEWRLTAGCRGLDEVILLPVSSSMPDTLELHYPLQSKVAEWYATLMCSSQSPRQQSAGQCLLSLGGASRTPGIGCPTQPHHLPGADPECAWNRGKLRNSYSALMTSSCGATQQQQVWRKGTE